MRVDPEDLIGVVIVGTLLLLALTVVGAAVDGVRKYRVAQVCFDAGYPSYRVLFWHGAYCVKRMDQTDVIVPLADVRR